MAEQVSIFEEFLAKVAAGAPMDVAASESLAKLRPPAQPAEPAHEEAADNETHAKRGARHR